MCDLPECQFLDWIDAEGGIYSLIDDGVDLESVPESVRQDWSKLTTICKESCEPLADAIMKTLTGALDK